MSSSRYLNLAQNWRQVIREQVWKRRPAMSAPRPLSYSVSDEFCRRIRVLWPSAYEWPEAANYVGELRTAMSSRIPLSVSPVAQPYQGIVVLEFHVDEERHTIVVDYSDWKDTINSEALERCTLYFKMQYRVGGYPGQPHATRLLPGGFATGTGATYHYLTPIRKATDSLPPLFDVYGRFGLMFAREVREKAVRLLKEQREFAYHGGVRKVRYSESLIEASRAKVCIDLPSNSDFCFRLIDYLAVGACIVGPQHGTTLPVPLVDGKHIAFTKPDLSDLVSLCRHYLEHPAERDAMRRNTREYFDAYMHREQLAAYYLSAFEQQLLRATT